MINELSKPTQEFQELVEAVKEIERLKAENARLAAALVAAREVLRNLHGWLPKTSEELWPMIEPVQGLIASTLNGNSTALRGLLGPTVELLMGLYNGGVAHHKKVLREIERLKELTKS